MLQSRYAVLQINTNICRSRPETPAKSVPPTPVPDESSGKPVRLSNRATTPNRPVTRQSVTMVTTTPLTGPQNRTVNKGSLTNLPQITKSSDKENVTVDGCEGEALPSIVSQQSGDILAVPDASYILGNRLYEERRSFQNVMGSEPDLYSLTENNAVVLTTSRTSLLDNQPVKTLQGSSYPALKALATTSFVPVAAQNKPEPNIPYQMVPKSQPSSEYHMESPLRLTSRADFSVGGMYLGPISDKSIKLRPLSAISGKSEGMSLEVPDDRTEAETSDGGYEITIPETDPGNEIPVYVSDESKDCEPLNENAACTIQDEECDESLARADVDNEPHEDKLDEVMRPQVLSGVEPEEYEDMELKEGRKSVEIEGELEHVLIDESAEPVDEMEACQQPSVAEDHDTDLEEFMRRDDKENEDEEVFERGATPNSHTTDYLRDDLSTSSIVRPNSGLDEALDPEFNCLTLASSSQLNDDDEYGEIVIKDKIKDAFDTPYLRDCAHTPAGETESESETVYEFCNESEDETSVVIEDSDNDDKNGQY